VSHVRRRFHVISKGRDSAPLIGVLTVNGDTPKNISISDIDKMERENTAIKVVVLNRNLVMSKEFKRDLLSEPRSLSNYCPLL
jgi:hypothetical protein